MSNIVVPVSFYRTSQNDFFLNDNIPNNAFILNSSNNSMYIKVEKKIYSITLNKQLVRNWKDIVEYANVASNPPELLPIGYTRKIKFKSSDGVMKSATAVLVDYNKDSLLYGTKAKYTFVVFTDLYSRFSTSVGDLGIYSNSDILKPLIDDIQLYDEQDDVIKTKTVTKYTNYSGYDLDAAIFPLDVKEITRYEYECYEYFKSASFPEKFIGEYWLRTDDDIPPYYPLICSISSNKITYNGYGGVENLKRVCFGFCL